MPWPIPEIGSLIPRETLEIVHPDYEARKDLWEFFRHSDELTGGYAANVTTYTNARTPTTGVASYLIPHTKEDDLDFAERVAHATPPRYVQEGIIGITGVLTEQEPNRTEYPDELTEWLSAVTAQGDTWQQVIGTSIVPLVERYGLVYTLGRRPTIDATNLGEQDRLREAQGLPEVLVHVISPEALRWWETDDTGRYEIVRYLETIETVELSEPQSATGTQYPTDNETIERHWWITDEGWWFADDVESTSEALSVTGVGTWNTDGSALENFPVVKWALKDERPPTEPASFAQLAYFRKESELSKIERASAFPMVVLQTESEDTQSAEIVKGADVVIMVPASSNKDPFYLEPSGVSFDHYVEKRLPELEEAALSPYGRNREVGQNDSGVALAHIQQTAKNIYMQHAQAFSKSEFAALQPISELLGIDMPADARAEWNNKFGTLSSTEQTENLTAFLEMEPGEEYEEHILRSMDKTLLQLSPTQTEAAIDAWKKDREERKSQESEMRDLEMEQLNGGGDDEGGPSMPAAGNPDVALREKARENGE